jgi:hypothetical protein
VFDLYGTERLIEWKKFRDDLENSQTPFSDVLELWSRAPFVESFLDPKNIGEWPDPWHLVLDGRFDDLALILGIMYTLKLTQRFMGSKFEIHMSMSQKENRDCFYLIVDDNMVYDIDQRRLMLHSDFLNESTTLIWSIDQIS